MKRLACEESYLVVEEVDDSNVGLSDVVCYEIEKNVGALLTSKYMHYR